MIPPAILAAILQHAESEYPRECCGMILSSANAPDKLLRARPCRNAQDEFHQRDPKNFPRTSANAFFIDPAELLTLQKELCAKNEIMRVIYHSHIDTGAYFSSEDKKIAVSDGRPAYPGVDYLVISVIKSKAGECLLYRWDPLKNDFLPLG